VWVAAGDTLAAFEPDGTEALRRPSPGLASLAPAPEGVVAARGHGVVLWFDGAGKEVAQRPVGSAVALLGAADGAYCVDATSGRAWAVAGAGTLGPPVAVPGVAGATVARGAIWWTSHHDTVLRGNGREVDLGVPAAAIAGCAGSVWASVDATLLRVGAWGGDISPPLAAPFGPALLSCGDGRLVGASADGVFVLDPSADAGVRALDVEIGEAPAIVVATRTAAWLFSAARPEAGVVPYR
jgi:hypothetical protein